MAGDGPSRSKPAAPHNGHLSGAGRAARGVPGAAIAAAVAAVLLVVAVLLVLGRRHPASATAGQSAYAPQIALSDLQLSESTNFAGGKETFVDGRIANHGGSTVTGATVEVVFASDGGGSPQRETVPVMLIRTRQPYIDTEPVSAQPLAPGGSAEFRLTFDDVRPDWNQQPPALRVAGVALR